MTTDPPAPELTAEQRLRKAQLQQELDPALELLILKGSYGEISAQLRGPTAHFKIGLSFTRAWEEIDGMELAAGAGG